MIRSEHYRQSEKLLEHLKDFTGSPAHTEFESRAQLIAAAQVHATLATADGYVEQDAGLADRAGLTIGPSMGGFGGVKEDER